MSDKEKEAPEEIPVMIQVHHGSIAQTRLEGKPLYRGGSTTYKKVVTDKEVLEYIAKRVSLYTIK
jgi:hypothetical protein